MRGSAWEREWQEEEFTFLATETPAKTVAFGGFLAGIGMVICLFGLWFVAVLGGFILTLLDQYETGESILSYLTLDMGWGTAFFGLSMASLLGLVGMGAALQKKKGRRLRLGGEIPDLPGEWLIFFLGTYLAFVILSIFVLFIGPYGFAEAFVDLAIAGVLVSGLFTLVIFPVWSWFYRRIIKRLSPLDYGASEAERVKEERRRSDGRQEVARSLKRFKDELRR